MSISFSNRSIENSLMRIAKSLESIDITLIKLTADDFTSEDEIVKEMAADAQAAKDRIPNP